MKIAVANYPITYHKSLEEWKTFVESWIQNLKGLSVDLAVFPEYGSMELASLLPKELQTDARAQVREMQKFLDSFKETYANLSAQFKICIVAPSFPEKLGEAFINRAYVFDKGKEIGFQDKLIMTPFETNDWGISNSDKVLSVFKISSGNFGIQICYDSEFPFGAHEMVKNGAQVIVMPSCTETLKGATRVHVGARARALENQCYTIVSQTMGEALWSPAVDYNYGYSAAYSTPDLGFPDLGILQEDEHQKVGWMIQDFDMKILDEVRVKGGVLNYQDSQKMRITLNGEPLKIKIVESI